MELTSWLLGDRNITVLPLHLYLAGLRSASSGLWVPNIIFDIKNEILTLTNLYLDILQCDIFICTWLTSRIRLQWPSGATWCHYGDCGPSSGFQTPHILPSTGQRVVVELGDLLTAEMGIL